MCCLEQLRPAALLAGLPGAAVVGVGADQRDHGGGLGEHHLLVRGLHLAPGGGLLQRRGRAGAVANVGHGDLHAGVATVHFGLDAEDLGADHGGPGRSSSARPRRTMEEASVTPAAILMSVSSRKSAGGVDGHVGLPGRDPLLLVLHQPKAGRAIDEGGAEDRAAFLVGGLDQAAGLFRVAGGQPLAHLVDELAARIGARLERIGDLQDRGGRSSGALPRRCRCRRCGST